MISWSDLSLAPEQADEKKSSDGGTKKSHPEICSVSSVVSAATRTKSQSRLLFQLTGSGGGGGFALLGERQEAGFLYHHGDRPVVAVGIFQRRQGLFL